MSTPKYVLLKRAGLGFVVFIFVVSIFILLSVFSSQMFDERFDWKRDVWGSVLGWYVWAFAVPVAVWLSDRYSFIQKRFWQSTLSLALFTFLFVVLKLFYNEFVLFSPKDFRHFDRPPVIARVFYSMLSFRFFMESIIFLAILASVYVVKYYRIIKEREIQARQLETELVQARLNSLQMQLQPHFLFNALNSISSLLREKLDFPRLQENVRAADQMITNLSEMFRHTLKTSDIQEVPLRDELVFLDNYIDIEKIRFADRLTVEKHVEPHLDSTVVPSFFLQPLVENAIRHGISRLSRQGIVRILIQKRGDCIEFTVQDNGPCSLEELKNKSNRGIGISNLRKRLQHLFGDSYRFEMKKNPNGETEVIVSIPCQDGQTENDGDHESNC